MKSNDTLTQQQKDIIMHGQLLYNCDDDRQI